MIQNFISMNGYGFFVWLSFVITFLACGIIYLKTYKTLKKYEKEFVQELDQLTKSEKKLVLSKSKVASQVLAAHNKSI